eukprot:1908602-Karenia_brevis.AAC.1
MMMMMNLTGWLHRRPGPCNDWADHMRAAFGDDWLDFAISSSVKEWRQTEDGFIKKLGRLWALPFAAFSANTVATEDHAVQAPQPGIRSS